MPPIETDEDTVLDPSTNTALDVADTTTVDPGAADALAASSDATGDTEVDTLSVVRDVVDAARKTDAASPAEGTEAGSETGGTASTKEPDNENFSDVPFHKHPRFQEVIRQRNSFKEDATRYQNVQNFLDTHGLASDEAADGLTIMARAKTDPAGAWAQIKPWVQKLLVAAGEVLPADLSERVGKGELTQDAAFELSRSRAQIASGESRKTFEQQQREAGEQTKLAQSLVDTATAWEKDRTIKDPNFKAKQPLIMREVAFLQATEGKPKTIEGVAKQLKAAYDAVNKGFKAAAPAVQQRRPAIKPVTGGTGTGTVREAPKSTLDIVRANRRAATA